MDKKVVQISISSLILDKRGVFDGAEDINLIRFSLSYPAEEIPSIETTKVIGSTKPIPTDWSSDFDKAIVFKTPIRGKAKLTIEAASVDKNSDAEKFFSKLFESLFGAVLGVWTGGFGSAYVGAITKVVGASLIDLVGHDDDVDIIGKASMMIDSESLPENIELDLVVEKDVVKKESISTPGGHPSSRRRRIVEKVVIPAGKNGSVKLRVERL